MTTIARPFTKWCVSPVASNVDSLLEAVSIPLLIRTIEFETKFSDAAKARLQRASVDAELVEAEFSSYVQQGITYIKAAIAIGGTPSSLPLYYAAQHFAKAELLLDDPETLLGDKIDHGISYDPSSYRELGDDFIRVYPSGVFPLLYKARTGKEISNVSQIQIIEVLASIPEILWELMQFKFAKPNYCRFMHSAVIDQTSIWSIVATPDTEFIRAGSACSDRFLEIFEEIEPPVPSIFVGGFHKPGLSTWQNATGASARAYSTSFQFFQSRDVIQSFLPGEISLVELNDRVVSIRRSLQGVAQDPQNLGEDFSITGFVNSDSNPMPSSVARYAALQYYSSLVRYRPSALDPVHFPAESWLAGALCDQSVIYLLRDALKGISGKTFIFQGEDGLRAQ
jgi:hypothetical protein